jgi:hypothetical protein
MVRLSSRVPLLHSPVKNSHRSELTGSGRRPRSASLTAYIPLDDCPQLAPYGDSLSTQS